MANDDFFKEENVEDNEVQTIKLGDKEYSQDDLSRLVGLGEIASEAEEKYKTKIDRVWPEYTKATQKNSDLQRQLDEANARINQPVQPQAPANQSMELTAEQKDLARKQLAELGFSQDSYRQIVREELAAKELLEGIDSLLADATENGQPQTTSQELLQYMVETGIKNPLKAYKDMFEEELDVLKEKKLSEIKPSGMLSTTGGQAGSKTPPTVKITKANLRDLVAAQMGGE